MIIIIIERIMIITKVINLFIINTDFSLQLPMKTLKHQDGQEKNLFVMHFSLNPSHLEWQFFAHQVAVYDWNGKIFQFIYLIWNIYHIRINRTILFAKFPKSMMRIFSQKWEITKQWKTTGTFRQTFIFI